MFERFANRVPRDVATVVSGRCHFHPDGQGYTTHCVFKNNRAVVVQSIIRDYDYGTYSDPFKHYQVMCRTLNKTLELVATLFDSINFRSHTRVYVNQTDQGLQLDQRRKSLAHLITCHLWAPYIFENEIEFTGWDTTWNTAYGYWAGKPVEIYYGYDDVTMKSLDRRMHAARTLRDLDLTQEVHGHLLNDDSEVIGLVVEPASGRLLRLEDRAQVYQAVAKLQRHYCILPNVRDGAILISEGKVRFPFVSEIRYYPPDQRSEFRESAERDHWQALDGVFAELEEGLTPQPITLFSAPLPVLFIPSYPLERPFPVVAMYINSRIMDSSYGTDDTEYNSVERPVLLGTQADVSFAIEQTGRALGARITLFRRSDIQRNRQALPSPTPAPGSLRVQRHVSQRRSRLDAAQLRLHNALNRRRRAKETGSDSYSDVTSESGSASSRIEEIF